MAMRCSVASPSSCFLHRIASATERAALFRQLHKHRRRCKFAVACSASCFHVDELLQCWAEMFVERNAVRTHSRMCLYGMSLWRESKRTRCCRMTCVSLRSAFSHVRRHLLQIGQGHVRARVLSVKRCRGIVVVHQLLVACV